MTPSKYIKSKGLPSAKYIAGEAGVHVDTIRNWYYNNHRHLELIIKGLLYERENDG